MKHKAKKISAVILSAVLAASSFSSIPAYADGETVQISSAEDFAAFSKNCTLDSWSRGKTINLTADISLADTDISPVPIFCGTSTETAIPFPAWIWTEATPTRDCSGLWQRMAL